MSEHIVVFSTVANEDDAEKLATDLIKNKFVACVNIIPKMRSIYEWDGAVRDEKECLLMMKTRAELFDVVKDHIKKNHEYEVPEIISLDIKEGLPQYLEWIEEVTDSVNLNR